VEYILRGLHIVIDSEGLHGGVHFEGGWMMEFILWGLNTGVNFEWIIC
jgi:hypothetical protein